MIPSLIQQLRLRSSALLMPRRPQVSAARAYAGGRRADSIVTTGKAAEEQARVFNDLLHTVCRKLLTNIRELDCVSGDLNSLMNVCTIPAIFVDEKLVVRRFTRESRQVYRLSRQHIGRSLLEVTCGLDYHGLRDDFRKVAETGKPVSRYLEKRGCENRYFMRMMPNFCRDESFGGAALIFIQVDAGYLGRA